MGITFKSLDDLLNYHLRLHPGMELVDVYKLVHQSVFGPEHLGMYLLEEAIEEEMHSPGGTPEELLLEPISIDGSSCRINLRAARRRGITSATIAQVISFSLPHFSLDRRKFEQLWSAVAELLPRLVKILSLGEFEEYTTQAKARDFPAVHHSSSYRLQNHPAYRVLVRRELEKITPPSASISDDLWLE